MNDNTTRNESGLFADDTGPIAQVREGMTVQDAMGQELGTVEYVQMGNPDAATTRGTYSQSNDLITQVAEAAFGGKADLPEPKRSQLLRYGFIRIDGPGLSDTDRFVRADKIKTVSGDTVSLSISKDQLITEQ